ncbi:hypothetical protein Krac_4361 [Ktedonobacter racemifer DSM 44963]|uniref:Uncharacterized protein n=1 Tax=Ktedonobacter racemifer DSM 44963 TaxID=485913 RepID=D6TSK4_KTERA|nr:hypothetical protein Krac_4361 [Ktedonobacter racemifer DSM 44963]
MAGVYICQVDSASTGQIYVEKTGLSKKEVTWDKPGHLLLLLLTFQRGSGAVDLSAAAAVTVGVDRPAAGRADTVEHQHDELQQDDLLGSKRFFSFEVVLTVATNFESLWVSRRISSAQGIQLRQAIYVRYASCELVKQYLIHHRASKPSEQVIWVLPGNIPLFPVPMI